MSNLNEAARLIKKAGKILVLTGAGMSTESGLKDFRSKDGLYSNHYRGHSPETILSAGFFRRDTRTFYDYVGEKLNVTGIEPNKGHRILASWEDTMDLSVITQNIDGLHQKAGSKRVLEIHGTLATTTCTRCGERRLLEEVLDDGYEHSCGGVFKPDVVLYDEAVDKIEEAFGMAEKADLLIILGTSLYVYPVASIPEVYGISTKKAIIVNRDQTRYSMHVNALEFNESISATLEKLDHLIHE
ncbi:NAD-dependent protein deacylase [Youngiibacter fragilis]|uniref:protein acetyllysine N-acetyltransferase n=1 Tax=Youngiibacter fragilis 232.1 TaxID=994573 RepID=V7IBB5_9CLOT|nr:NAD-dependent protein deacylase [Youngiibacter fragilis]ETA82634.1 NAD-dependent deacetylase [Youngiibacter fragilis 232.1]